MCRLFRNSISGATASKTRFSRVTWAVLGTVLAGSVGFIACKPGAPTAERAYVPRPTGSVTFCKDIAPVVFNHCSGCHRPGQSGPFQLLTYAEVKKHAEDIVTVTRNRFMPPWQPEPGYGEFVGERRLTEDQIGLIRQWVAEGAVEGQPKDLPPQPAWANGWQLGEPDLVVQMPKPYILPEGGKDVYRNFVVPIPITNRHYVQAVEFQPGNRTVHHTFLLYDRTRQSRRIDEQDADPGFPGMSPPVSASAPPGQFFSWQPGKVASKGNADSIWTLEPGTDLVMQMHMQPSGKPEPIQPSVGFYFTDTPPNPALSKVAFNVYHIDIPAGATDCVVTDSYVLPVDAEVVGVLPHAHYLGKQVEGFAVLPDGTKRWLLFIKHWDFNWQGDYQFRQPVPVPKGSTLTMRWTYDNSNNNVRNPNHPPARVRYGVNSSDEMAELSFRLKLRDTNDLARLEADLIPKTLRDVVEFNTWRLGQDPSDAIAHARLGQALIFVSGREQEGLDHLRTAVRLAPDLDEAHYALGLALRNRRLFEPAAKEFETVIRLNPSHNSAYGNLGFVLAELGYLDRSEQALRMALQLNPEDVRVRAGLTELLQARQRIEKSGSTGLSR
jgi:mono/diheme cytochrome c family protein